MTIYKIKVENDMVDERFELAFNLTKNEMYGLAIELKRNDEDRILVDKENVCEDPTIIIRIMNSLIDGLTNKNVLDAVCNEIQLAQVEKI